MNIYLLLQKIVPYRYRYYIEENKCLKKISNFFVRRLFADKFVKVNIDSVIMQVNPYRMAQWRNYIINETLPEHFFLLPFKELCRNKSLIIDIGANWGLYTLLAAKYTQNSGKVIAIEPDKNNCRILQGNIQNNRLTNIELLQIAVGGHNYYAKIFEDNIHSGGSTLNKSGKKNEKYDMVEVRTLDQITKDTDKVDIIKIDIEGAEGLLFKGAENILATKKAGYIFLELHRQIENFDCGYNYIIEKLLKYGFFLYYYDREKNKYKPLDKDNKELIMPLNRVYIIASSNAIDPSQLNLMLKNE